MKRTEQIVDFITQFTVLPFDIKTAETSARIHAALGKRGESIGIPDTLIAGICVAADIPLLTLNIRHFSRITDLALIKNLS
jgi:tRNA(fMet)-specific endonuclease VapC